MRSSSWVLVLSAIRHLLESTSDQDQIEAMTLVTSVPPWVDVFAGLNPKEVEIIEMTNPFITGGQGCSETERREP